MGGMTTVNCKSVKEKEAKNYMNIESIDLFMGSSTPDLGLFSITYLYI